MSKFREPEEIEKLVVLASKIDHMGAIAKLYDLNEGYQKLQEENKLLRDALQKYTHEEVRGIYIKEFIIKGHSYDNSCFACTEYNKGELARKTLAKIKGDE